MRLAAGAAAFMLLAACARGSHAPSLVGPTEARVSITPSPRTPLYFASKQGFALQYPAGWTATTGSPPHVAAFTSPQEGARDPFWENASVVIEPLADGGEGLVQYADLAEERVRERFPDTAVSVTVAALAGQPARQFDYTATAQGTQARIRQIVALHDGSAYALTFASAPEAFPQWEPIFESIASSFTFT